MTIAIANRTETNVFAVADTRITAYRHRKPRHPVLEGASKIYILDKNALLCVAGQLDDIEQVLPRLYAVPSFHGREEILSAISSSGNSEYLLASHEPLLLKKISDGSSTECATGWIGDHEAFEIYQSFFAAETAIEEFYRQTTSLLINRMPQGASKTESNIFGRMFRSLQAAIDSNRCASIGGFVVPAFFEYDQFTFGIYASIFRRPIDPEVEITTGGWNKVSFQGAAEGSYQTLFAPVGEGKFAVYIPQGRLGLIFSQLDSPLLEPIHLTNIDEIDFKLHVTGKFGEWHAPTSGHTSIHYFQKAENALNGRQFLKAEELATEGIRLSSQTWNGIPPHREYRFSTLADGLAQIGELQIPTEEVSRLKHGFRLRAASRVEQLVLTTQYALQDLAEALQLDSDFVPALILQAKILDFRGLFSESADILLKCVSLKPSDEKIREICKEVLMKAGRDQEAEELNAEQGEQP